MCRISTTFTTRLTFFKHCFPCSTENSKSSPGNKASSLYSHFCGLLQRGFPLTFQSHLFSMFYVLIFVDKFSVKLIFCFIRNVFPSHYFQELHIMLYFDISASNLYPTRDWKQSESVLGFPFLEPSPDLGLVQGR